MRFDILTIFPQLIEGVLDSSILGRARKAGIIEAQATDIRAFAQNKHKNTDDTPFGGGAGMVMLAQPICDAMKQVCGDSFKGRRIYLSPKGAPFTQQKAEELAKEEHLVLLCGHYEGIDQRVIDSCIDEEISVGDYVLTGGELGALIITDAVARLIPGVLGCDESSVDESFSSGLLEYPQYTHPREFEGMAVPEVLLNGNQKLIDRWRRDEALKITLARRPEMLESTCLDGADRALLRKAAKKRTVHVYIKADDPRELTDRLNEISEVEFKLTQAPESAEAFIYLGFPPDDFALKSGRPIYADSPMEAGERRMSASPVRFSKVLTQIRGDEWLTEAKISCASSWEFACAAASLLPLHKMRGRICDYGKSRCARFTKSDAANSSIQAVFKDGAEVSASLSKLPHAFIEALSAFLTEGKSPVSEREARDSLDIFAALK